MNRGPSNYFLILCDVIIVLLIVIDGTMSSTRIFLSKISFVCIYQIIVICSLLSVLFLILVLSCWDFYFVCSV